ncbi:hypothetical protein DXG01_010664 [Tephrocybe rancida]|nr:hypothetical protein DXG01_010664 [Tephrocybe rancida]
MSAPSLSLPLATVLREGTHQAHETVSKSQGALALASGRLPKPEYIRYLMVLWHVYDALEQALEQHATHPTLESTYNPTLLARGTALTTDISFLLEVPESSWKSHSMHIELLKEAPQALTAYVAHLRELADAPDPSPLLAHSYVRYVGDLSGGHIIRRFIGKAYNLDSDDSLGQGLAFYSFKELTSAKPATQGKIKHIKDWFKAGMDKAGEQALVAFELNSGLLATIKVDAQEPKETSISVEQPLQEKTYPGSQAVVVAA